MINSFLRFFLNDHIWLYFSVLASIFLFLAYYFSQKSRRISDWQLLSFLILVLLAKLPQILFNNVVNPDESQVLSQALTILHDPAMFRSFDGNTSGPINSYVVALLGFLGLPMNYSVSHFVMAFFQGIILIMSFLSVREFSNPKNALISIVPFFVMFLLSTHYDFNHNSSELIAVSIIGFLTFSFFKQKNDNLNTLNLISIGFLGAMILLCKLQSAPMAFFVIVFIIFDLFRKSRTEFLKSFLKIIGGGVLFFLIVFGFLITWGSFKGFIDFYVIGNLIHSNDTKISTFEFIQKYFQATSDSLELQTFLLATLLSLCVVVYFYIKKKTQFSTDKTSYFFVLVYLFSTLYAIGKSGFPFYHYMYFLFWGLTILIGLVLKDIIHKDLKISYLAIVFMLISSVFIYNYSFKNLTFNYKYNGRLMSQSVVSNEIKKLSKPGDLLVVWGWQIEYHVETQLAQGTCDNHTIRCFEFSLVDEHKKRYLEDIKRNKPRIFVDAVAKSSFYMNDRATYGLQHFEELETYINQNYQLVSVVDDNRIFIRN